MNDKPKILDEGRERVNYSGGAKKEESSGKGRYDLLPPYALRRLALHYEGGAKKYGDRNWETGIPITRLLEALIRHAFQYLAGDRDEDHMAAVMWNSAAILEFEERIKRNKMSDEFLMFNDPERSNTQCQSRQSDTSGMNTFKDRLLNFRSSFPTWLTNWTLPFLTEQKKRQE